jgi:2-succinyl-5-enolpyruvyl-6-hydroxy-3-cyclohexene-1-carboxylate synthase
LRKTGANQTTNQLNIFPGIKTHDLASEIDLKALLKSGPIHLNVQFDEPLISQENYDWLSGLKVVPNKYSNTIAGSIEVGEGVLVIGHDRGGYTIKEINDFAAKLNWPIIAEDPISFPKAIAHASLLLSDQKILERLTPENVVVIGRTTLSRSTNNFIKFAKNLIVIDPRILEIDSKREGNLLLPTLPAQVKSSKSEEAIWKKASDLASNEIATLEWSEQLAITSICKSLPDQSALFVGSSRPVRDVEAFCHPRSGIDVFANRGLAGIDGNISTIFGIAREYQNTFAILGDLTFLHDISALTNCASENIRIFVIDNNGGAIFSTLPQAGVDNFDQLFGTPHNLDLAKVCAGFNVPVSSVSNMAELQRGLDKDINGLEVVIVKVPTRQSNAEKLKEITQRVSSAVRIGINLA